MMSHGARAPLSRMLEHIRERTARHEAPVTHETLLTARELGHERGAQLGHTVGIHRIGDGIVLLARVTARSKYCSRPVCENQMYLSCGVTM